MLTPLQNISNSPSGIALISRWLGIPTGNTPAGGKVVKGTTASVGCFLNYGDCGVVIDAPKATIAGTSVLWRLQGVRQPRICRNPASRYKLPGSSRAQLHSAQMATGRQQISRSVSPTELSAIGLNCRQLVDGSNGGFSIPPTGGASDNCAQSLRRGAAYPFAIKSTNHIRVNHEPQNAD